MQETWIHNSVRMTAAQRARALYNELSCVGVFEFGEHVSLSPCNKVQVVKTVQIKQENEEFVVCSLSCRLRLVVAGVCIAMNRVYGYGLEVEAL